MDAEGRKDRESEASAIVAVHALLPRIGTLLIEAHPDTGGETGLVPPADPNAGRVGPACSSNRAPDPDRTGRRHPAGGTRSNPNTGRGRGSVLARRESADT
ncbi:MAG: hypothetical protein ACNA7J_15245, partial [Wenzhouxiangella sp.]